jgi:hypothetical protein
MASMHRIDRLSGEGREKSLDARSAIPIVMNIFEEGLSTAVGSRVVDHDDEKVMNLLDI